MYTRIAVVCGGLLLLQALAGGAAAHTLEEIVVTADPLSGVDSSLSQAVQVLTAKQLRNKAVRNVGETVAGELGVSASDFGPSVGRPVIRGLSGSRVRVLENGVGTMDASTVGPDHAVSAESVFADQIEIFRGPATLLYGSGASGGLINISSSRIPDRVPDRPEADLYLHYDSVADGIMGAARVNAGRGDFALQLDGMVRSTGDYAIPGYAALQPEPGARRGVLENTDNETHNYSAGAAYLGDHGNAGLSVSRYESDYGLPPVGDEEGERIDLKQTRYDFRAALDNPLPGFRKVKTRWGYNDYRHNVLEADGAIGTRLHNQGVEGRLELVHEPVGNWNGVLGMQYRYRDFSARGEEITPSIRQDSAAAFLLEKGDYGTWHLNAGLRYERQHARQSGTGKNHDAFSVSGGVTWYYRDGYDLDLNITRSQRAPDIEELFGGEPAHPDTGVFVISNPSLDDETSLNIDLSWHRSAGRLRLTANLYWHRIADFIYLRQNDLNGDGRADRVPLDYDGNPADILAADESGGLFLVNQAQATATFRGTELEGVYRLIDRDGESLALRLWTDYVRATLAGGQNLPRITPWRFGGGIDYARGPWEAGLEYTRVNRQDDTAPLETPTAGYHMLDFHGSRRLDYAGMTFSLFVHASNLLDQEARRHTSFLKQYAPLPGRSVMLGLRGSY